MSSRKKGKLFLVPTSIAEKGDLSNFKRQRLIQAFEDQDLICVEDMKPARRRWLAWELPREAIEKFVSFNEHTQEKLAKDMVEELKRGRNIFLMSDGGMPAFCDPGRPLIERCHDQGLEVQCLDTDNSLIAALSLSGFSFDEFVFLGFPPQKSQQRKEFFEVLDSRLASRAEKKVFAFMDTPYRLNKVLLEMKEGITCRPQMSISLNICRDDQATFRGDIDQMLKNLKDIKAEFVVVIRG